MTGFLKHLKQRAFGRLSNPDGSPNRDAIDMVFKSIDRDGDDVLSQRELGAFVVGMNFQGLSMGTESIVQKLMKEVDTRNLDDIIDREEFAQGISKLLKIVRGGETDVRQNADTLKHLNDYDAEAETEHLLLGDSTEEAGEEIENTKATTMKAILFLVLGTIIAGVFADPLVDAVDNFSKATSIPSFFISFIFLPLATNSSEAVSAIVFASRKKRRSASLTFSEVWRDGSEI